mmetsp:Transcript_45020/g.119366  ORF Transcript_45020/g.119366 Transcript_45020/m.119366 type:complete len:347 (+) Transcript_45020:155-1195(+)
MNWAGALCFLRASTAATVESVARLPQLPLKSLRSGSREARCSFACPYPFVRLWAAAAAWCHRRPRGRTSAPCPCRLSVDPSPGVPCHPRAPSPRMRCCRRKTSPCRNPPKASTCPQLRPRPQSSRSSQTQRWPQTRQTLWHTRALCRRSPQGAVLPQGLQHWRHRHSRCDGSCVHRQWQGLLLCLSNLVRQQCRYPSRDPYLLSPCPSRLFHLSPARLSSDLLLSNCRNRSRPGCDSNPSGHLCPNPHFGCRGHHRRHRNGHSLHHRSPIDRNLCGHVVGFGSNHRCPCRQSGHPADLCSSCCRPQTPSTTPCLLQPWSWEGAGSRLRWLGRSFAQGRNPPAPSGP